jgi:hypothetical protein
MERNTAHDLHIIVSLFNTRRAASRTTANAPAAVIERGTLSVPFLELCRLCLQRFVRERRHGLLVSCHGATALRARNALRSCYPEISFERQMDWIAPQIRFQGSG